MNSAELFGLMATMLLIFVTFDLARSMRAEEQRLSGLRESKHVPWQSTPRIIERGER
ncbi:MAG: hypothetical protein HKN07_08930 [Acidimicrobiia bacterium]|nr:hypothetical protein [Acidimicrobiia bacterium]